MRVFTRRFAYDDLLVFGSAQMTLVVVTFITGVVVNVVAMAVRMVVTAPNVFTMQVWTVIVIRRFVTAMHMDKQGN